MTETSSTCAPIISAAKEIANPHSTSKTRWAGLCESNGTITDGDGRFALSGLRMLLTSKVLGGRSRLIAKNRPFADRTLQSGCIWWSFLHQSMPRRSGLRPFPFHCG